MHRRTCLADMNALLISVSLPTQICAFSWGSKLGFTRNLQTLAEARNHPSFLLFLLLPFSGSHLASEGKWSREEGIYFSVKTGPDSILPYREEANLETSVCVLSKRASPRALYFPVLDFWHTQILTPIQPCENF